MSHAALVAGFRHRSCHFAPSPGSRPESVSAKIWPGTEWKHGDDMRCLDLGWLEVRRWMNGFGYGN